METREVARRLVPQDTIEVASPISWRPDSKHSCSVSDGELDPLPGIYSKAISRN